MAWRQRRSRHWRAGTPRCPRRRRRRRTMLASRARGSPRAPTGDTGASDGRRRRAAAVRASPRVRPRFDRQLGPQARRRTRRPGVGRADRRGTVPSPERPPLPLEHSCGVEVASPCPPGCGATASLRRSGARVGDPHRRDRRQGVRNATLFREAVSLAELVAAEVLSEEQVWRDLTHAARSVGLRAFEIRVTLASAFRRGLRRPRLPF
jgi:hypothetical protein